jgi:hypothetical protein
MFVVDSKLADKLDESATAFLEPHSVVKGNTIGTD